MSSADPPAKRPLPGTWRLVLWVGLPLATLFAGLAGAAGYSEGGVSSALLFGAGAFGGTVLFVGALISLIGLLHVLASTGGGQIPLDDAGARDGYTLELELGGTPQSAWDRVQSAVLKLAGAKIVRSDEAAGTLEVRADGREFGNLAQHVVTAALLGTHLTCTVRHDPTRKPLDFGTTRKQADALFARLRESALPSAEGEQAPEPVRRPGRVHEDGA